jgi:hypothetical protein
MRGGEVAAMMYEALNTDLSEFEKVRRRPVMTKAKAKLALITGNEARTFLFHLLEAETWPGFLQSADKTNIDPRCWKDKPIHFDDGAVYGSYLKYMEREHKRKTPVSTVQFWAEVDRVFGVGTITSLQSWVVFIPNERKGRKQTVNRLPSRTELRAIWEKRAGFAEWPSETMTEGDVPMEDGEDTLPEQAPDFFPDGYEG